MKKEDKILLKMLVRAREDFQSQRKRMDNRIGRKADGGSQDVDTGDILAEDMPLLEEIADASRKQEKDIEKKMLKALKRFPIYNEWLKDVKGVGTVAAAHIISQIDIHIATNVSKIWQYCGLNPSLIRGKKRISTPKPKTYQSKEGKVLARRDDHVIVLTTEMIRGDKLTSGFISPYNKNLKTALVGVLASGFIKAQAPYALDYYYPYKERLANSNKITKHRTRGKVVEIPWKDVTPGHRDMAAKRYMIKMFIKDLYVVWRGVEGLPVRESYQEQYLNHKHAV